MKLEEVKKLFFSNYKIGKALFRVERSPVNDKLKMYFSKDQIIKRA